MTIEESIFDELVLIGSTCEEKCRAASKTACKLHTVGGVVLPDGEIVHCYAVFAAKYRESHKFRTKHLDERSNKT